MPNKCVSMVGGGFMEISEVDLEFEFEGKPTYMEFHRYCGPSFYHLSIHGDENWLEPDNTERYNSLWANFYDWYNIHHKEAEL